LDGILHGLPTGQFGTEAACFVKDGFAAIRFGQALQNRARRPFEVLFGQGEHKLFIVLLTVSLATQFFGDLLARRLKQQTELAARSNLWGNIGVFLALPVAFRWLWPEVPRVPRRESHLVLRLP